MLKIFEGPNGYYIADENDEGFHHQPSDGGSKIGWNGKRAEQILRERQREGAQR